MITVRRGQAGDLAELAAIQKASPEAAQWDVTGYLGYELRIAMDGAGRGMVGFLAWRRVDAAESEVLNMAIRPEWRRRGVARELMRGMLAETGGEVFLEVRESNAAARNLYKSMGFQEVSSRPAYYEDPREAAIVMKFHSC